MLRLDRYACVPSIKLASRLSRVSLQLFRVVLQLSRVSLKLMKLHENLSSDILPGNFFVQNYLLLMHHLPMVTGALEASAG